MSTRSRRRKRSGKVCLIITPRVRTVQSVPRGYELGECHECKAPLWVNAHTREVAEVLGLTVKCLCYGGC